MRYGIRRNNLPRFRAGTDNTPALVEALRRRPDEPGEVVWLHGPQPVEPVEADAVDRAIARVPLCGSTRLQVVPGANKALRRLARAQAQVVGDSNAEGALESARVGDRDSLC